MRKQDLAHYGLGEAKFETRWRNAEALSDLIFRACLSPIFIIGGLGHFVQHQPMIARIQESPWLTFILMIGDPSILLWLSGIVFVVAGIALLIGWMTRSAASLLFITLIPITFSIHVAPGHTGPLLKNVAILGALIHYMINGAGRISLDAPRVNAGAELSR